MLLKTIKLENIRSFLKQEISFKEGTTLLAGDIGTGKSSILQALEFGLFGLKRGELSGGNLLRNGKEIGAVELSFTLNNQEVFIKRTLKRTNLGITQDFGFLSINGKGQDYTSTELKHHILSLLNYPQENLSKKSMIYRYTVYTPQEDMKLILSGNEEDRLETLRKVFTIDKYKRVRENAKIATSKIRERKKELAAKIYDLESKKIHYQERRSKIEEIQKNLARLYVETFQENTLKKKNILLEEETKIKHFQDTKKQLSFDTLELTNKTKILTHNLKQQQELAKENLIVQDIKNYFQEIKIHQELILNVEKNLKTLSNKLQELKTKQHASKTLQENITKLNNCPTCLQEVGQEHKHTILTKEQILLKELEEQLKTILKEETDTAINLEQLKKELDLFREKQKQEEILALKKQDYLKKQEMLKLLKEEFDLLGQEQKLLEEKIKNHNTLLETLKNVEQAYILAKEEYEKANKQEQEIILKQAVLIKEKELEEKNLLLLEKEIKEKETYRTLLQEYTTKQDWIEDTFLPTLENIEKNVMSKVHTDFNSHFQKWFKLLIEGQTLSVSLDAQLAPLIEQNGHQTDYESLSGGERTAAALAYRLALNQVINNIVTNLNTKELIILDEPTDGFSSEQTEKLRDVIKELNMRQIIIVSHEQEIESFADTIITLAKQEHVSSIL